MPLELKSTLNLPKTDFPMKANLPQNEPKILARWEEMGIYERIREARKARLLGHTSCTMAPPTPTAPCTWDMR